MPADVADDGPRSGLLSVQATAQVLGVSVNTVYRMIEDGRIAAIAHGRKSWIDRDAITDYWARIKDESAKRRDTRAKATRAGTKTPRRRPLKAVAG